MALPPELLTQLGDYIADRRLKPADLLFATRDGTPISRNTFRTRVWRPAVAATGIDFPARVHDLRHAQITTIQKYLHTLPDADQKNRTRPDPQPCPCPSSRT